MELGVKGIVTCTLKDLDGNILEKKVYHNIQTNFSRNALASWITGVSTQSLPPPTSIQLGNGVGTPSGSDTALFSPFAGTLSLCDTIQTVQTYYAQFVKTYQATDPVGQYTEVGLFDAAGNLWGHVNINQYKSNQQLLTIQWQVYFTYDGSVQNSLMTSYALSALAQWMTGTPNVGANALIPPSQIILGSGSGTPSINDTSLFSPVAGTIKTCEYIQTSSSGQSYFGHTYNSSDPAGTFTEMGLQDTNGNLWTKSILNPAPTRSGNNVLSASTSLNFIAS